MIFESIQEHQFYKNWHYRRNMSQTKWHLNHSLHLSCFFKQTLVFTTKPPWLKRKVANIELVAVFTRGWLSRKTVVTWSCPFRRHRMTWSLCCWYGHSSQAAKLGNDWPLLLQVTSPVPLEERQQEASFIQGSAAPELHGCDELGAHMGLPHGRQKCNAKAATLFFFYSQTKSKKLFRIYSKKRSTARCGTILLLTVNAELIYKSFLTFSRSFPCHS